MTLLSHWPLHEDSSDVRSGSVGTNNGVSFVGGGPIGQDSGEFVKADNDNIVTNFQGGLDNTANWSASAWIYWDDDGSNQSVFSCFADGTTQKGWVVRTDIAFYYDSSANSISLQPGVSIPFNTWTHIAFVVENDVPKWYVDGELTNESGSSNRVSSGTEPVHIGARPPNTGDTEYFDGRIADARIYDHALSTSEVAYLYQVSQGATYTSSKKTL
jgi:hypothetical protein